MPRHEEEALYSTAAAADEREREREREREHRFIYSYIDDKTPKSQTVACLLGGKVNGV